MLDRERRPTKLLSASDGLRKLLLENPGLPLLVFAGEEANSGDYSQMSCSSVSAEKGEFLDCIQEVNDERVYTDRDDFAEDLADHLYDTYGALEWDGTDREWDEFVERHIDEYDPYWRDCIILTVDN